MACRRELGRPARPVKAGRFPQPFSCSIARSTMDWVTADCAELDDSG